MNVFDNHKVGAFLTTKKHQPEGFIKGLNGSQMGSIINLMWAKKCHQPTMTVVVSNRLKRNHHVVCRTDHQPGYLHQCHHFLSRITNLLSYHPYDL